MYKNLDACLCCGKSNLFTLLDLDSQPLANSYHTKSQILDSYPLSTNICLNCFHTQLSVSVDPDLMFKNYLYVSGTSQTLKDYFNWFARYIHAKYGVNNLTKNKVLDIASNDGSQLEQFKQFGYELYGVDPAENLSELSKSKGVNLTVGYWDENTAKNLPKMDFIICQNVIAHNADPLGFLKSCRIALNDSGRVFIQTSQANMFMNNEFDTIYHEHISFFSSKSMKTLAERSGFIIEDVFKPSIHGTSYVFILSSQMDGNQDKINDLIAQEAREGREDIVFYSNYVKKVMDSVNGLKELVEKYRNKGIKVVGYGAAAKGNTLLNFGKINLDYIVDDNIMKVGLLTPGMDIDILSPSELSKESNDLVVVPLAWNFFDEIKGNVSKIRGEKTTKFIKYFPKIEVL